MYCTRNFKTKKGLKEAVKRGENVTIKQPGIGREPYNDGLEFVEGPHYPELHKWYAQVEMKDGVVVKIRR